MLGPVPGVKRRRYIKIHVIKPDIVVLKIWKQDIVKQKLCNWLITLAKQNLFISDLLFFFRWGGTLSQLVKSIEIYTKDQACFSYYRLNILFTKQPCN